MSDTQTPNPEVATAAAAYTAAERAGRVEMHTGTIAEAFKVQIDALRSEAERWRTAAEKHTADLAAAQGRIAELEQVAAAARRSLAEGEVKAALAVPGATPLQIRGVLAELGADIYDDTKRADAITKARELLKAELGSQAPRLAERVQVNGITPRGLIRMS